MDALLHSYLLREKASKPFCLLGIKKKRNYSYLLTTEKSKSLKIVYVSITLGSESNIYPLDIAEHERKKSDINAAMGYWDLLTLLLLCVQHLSNTGKHNTVPLPPTQPKKLNRKLIFKETTIFRFPVLGNILAGLQPVYVTIRNSSHSFYSRFPRWAQLVLTNVLLRKVEIPV